MTSKLIPVVFSVGAITLCLIIPPICFAQAQEVIEEINGGLQPRRPSTPMCDIQKAPGAAVMETKGFQDKVPLLDFLKKLEASISKKGKEIHVRIDQDAFRVKDDEILYVHREEVGLPKVPSKMVAHTVLRLAISQVGKGEATSSFRSGQVLITSITRAKSTYFMDSTIVEGIYKNRPLVEALDELAEQAGVSIVIDSRVSNKAQTKVTAKFAAKLPAAVRLLTDTAGLKHVVVDNVIYVTSPENAREFKKETEFPLSDWHGGGRVEVSKNAPLSKAIELAWGNYVIDGRIKNKMNIRVTAKWLNHVEPDTKLRLLTDMAGLKHVVVDDVAYITSPANAKKLEEESRKKP